MASVHGGPSRAIKLIQRALQPLGVDVEVATTSDDGPGRRLPASEVSAILASASGHTGCLPNIYHVFEKRTEFYKIAPGFLPWIVKEAGRFDLIHLHALFSFTCTVAAWAARRAEVPYIVRPLGTLARYGMTQRRPTLKRLSFSWNEGPLLRDAAAVHFTSEAERDEALGLGVPIRSAVIPLGVDDAKVGDAVRFRASLPRCVEGTVVVYLGRLDPVKNVEGLLGALGRIRREGLRPTLLVAGDGPADYRRALESRAAAEGVAAQVHWLGEVRGQRKSGLLAAGDVFALPSFSENFGIAAAEALAAGLPCVLGRGVAIAGAVRDAGAGCAVEPTPEAIADGLRTYLTDPGLRASAGVAARVLAAREYSTQAMGRRLVALYESIVRG